VARLCSSRPVCCGRARRRQRCGSRRRSGPNDDREHDHADAVEPDAERTDAAAGVVFLDVIGAGSAADIQDDIAMAGLAPHDSTCGAVEQLPFVGFIPPVANLPKPNSVQPGQAVPVKFTIENSNGTVTTCSPRGS
jgi:hypothetical protein